MNYGFRREKFYERLRNFAPARHHQTRLLALYSAAIAVAEPEGLDMAVEHCRRHQLERSLLYEIVLQSYLFLGFPRMLRAAEHLHSRLPAPDSASQLHQVDADESKEWFTRGVALCQKVYATNYDRLKERVEHLAPEIFRWMVIEGYGKVLSRPELNVIERELAIVSCLMIENYDKQLYSHIKGALNVGASFELLQEVIEDLGEGAGDGYLTARSIMEELGR